MQWKETFHTQPPLPREGIHREWVASTLACGGHFVSGYWVQSVKVRPGPCFIWHADLEDWIHTNRFVVGRDDIPLDYNIALQLRRRNEDYIRAENYFRQQAPARMITVKEPDPYDVFQFIDRFDFFYRPTTGEDT